MNKKTKERLEAILSEYWDIRDEWAQKIIQVKSLVRDMEAMAKKAEKVAEKSERVLDDYAESVDDLELELWDMAEALGELEFSVTEDFDFTEDTPRRLSASDRARATASIIRYIESGN